MNILLVSPAVDATKRTNKGLRMPQLAMFILEGLTPAGHTVKVVEEEAETLNYDEPCDLVGISCMTANAPRSYEIAREFKKRGKTVILGGVHPTILPDEAIQHADSVVIGEAEGVWEQLLHDFEFGILQKRYHNPQPDLSQYVPKNFKRLAQKRLFDIIPIMTTRGCPYNCEFCCVTDLFGKKIRHIPVENVVKDIQESGAKNFMFLDDNIIGQPRYAKELFRAIKPLKIKWVGQASISLVKDSELLQLAADSGCKALFIGLESVSEDQLKTMHKSIKEIGHLEEALRKIKKMGILIHASMIFGFDNDTEKTFNDTLKFLVKNKIGTVSFNILTPYPGTKTYHNLEGEGRILTHEWQYYDHNTVVFKPNHMSPFELQVGKTLTRKRFYSISCVLKRFFGNLNNPLIYLAMNYGHMKQVRVEEKRIPYLKIKLQELLDQCPENNVFEHERAEVEF
ncbi:MAG: B12-binding domain-containing radical SAM protein [Bacteroidales bacterium]|nr:B12-binding domain-containing radical SAM protein [Bacteroidales bacterium]